MTYELKANSGPTSSGVATTYFVMEELFQSLNLSLQPKIKLVSPLAAVVNLPSIWG